MKNKKLTIVIISVVFALLLLLFFALVLSKVERTGKHYTEQGAVIERDKGEEFEGELASFVRRQQAKQIHSNADIKGGSKTIGVIKPEDDGDAENSDPVTPGMDILLPGIW